MAWLPISGNAAGDKDGDGIPDTQDNCTEIANANQQDSDNDGFGNACDADLNNDGYVGFKDLDLFKSAFIKKNASSGADFNSDGIVSFSDFDTFKKLYSKPPGPAGSGEDVVKSITAAKAAQFLTQCTFGPTTKDINHLVNMGSYEKWLTEQFNLPSTFHRPRIKTRDAHSSKESNRQFGRMDAWWNSAVHSKDQCRQRVAFALSETLVASDTPKDIKRNRDLIAEYNDILVRHSFGNYRDLLEDITLNPAMGIYLSMLGNDKPDPSINRQADENYAREVMQLFSIGLTNLDLTGKLKSGPDGNSIPSFTEEDVRNLAKIFTGWSWSLPNHTGKSDAWLKNLEITTKPMIAFSEHHDSNEKNFLGVTFPAGQTAREDLDLALDTLFNHPNVGPFIGKQLIIKLVTSNPTPGYVARVAKAFNNNGQGVRGDMQAVIKAILLDPEARSSTTNQFGKLKEPLLRITHLWRAFNASGGKTKHRTASKFVNYEALHFFEPEKQLSQAPYRSSSVFNFFRPDFSPFGKIKDAKLIAPEFQITSETRLQKLNQTVIDLTSKEGGSNNRITAKLNLSTEIALINDPARLIDHLDLLLTYGSMSDGLSQILLNYINTNRSKISDDNKLVQDLIILISTSAEYSIQR
jgi:uncharacterized protein (DUF1800 family)